MKTTKNLQFKVSHRLAKAEVIKSGKETIFKELEEVGGGSTLFIGPKAEAQVLKYLQGLQKNKNVIEKQYPGECIKMTVAVNSELPAMPAKYLPALPLVPLPVPHLMTDEQPAVEAPARPKRKRVAKVIEMAQAATAASKWQIAI